MEIPDNNSSIKSNACLKRVDTGHQKAGPSDQGLKTAGGEDRFELTSQAKELQQAKEFIAKIPDIDQEKVQRLKTQIKNGSYKIKTDKIANKMLEDSLYNQYL